MVGYIKVLIVIFKEKYNRANFWCQQLIFILIILLKVLTQVKRIGIISLLAARRYIYYTCVY